MSVATLSTVPDLRTVDPSTLLVDLNIREAQLDAAFVENIRANGVIQPPIVHQTEDGLRVVMGHRRALAAVQVGHPEMYVLITDTPEDAERLIKQISENDARTGLTDAERAFGYEQLALLGVSAAKIAERTGAPDTATVKKALAARKNAKGTAALDAGHTLDQALALVEFEDDEYAVSQLEEIIERQPEQFQHRLAQLRNERAMNEKRAEAAAPYVERGLTVVDNMGNYPGSSDVLYLSALEDAEGNQPREDAADSVYVRLWHVDDDARVDLGIKDWEAKGFKARYRSGGANSGPMTEEQKAERKAERKELIANNKAADAAELVRREWITTLLARKTAPKGWERFLALAYGVHYRITEDRKADIATKLLGLKAAEKVSYWEPLDTVAKHITEHPARPATALLGLVLASFEGSLRRDSWRSPNPSHRFYLNQLATWGYTLSEVEKLITAEPETEKD